MCVYICVHSSLITCITVSTLIVEEIEDAQQLQIDLERAREEALLALSEDEFEALDSETKERIERKRYELKKERLRRYVRTHI